MPQPGEITEAAEASIALWRQAEAQIRQRLAAIADTRSKEAVKLRAMLHEVDTAIDTLRGKIPGDIETRISAVYAQGATDTGLMPIFTQTNRAAVQAMAEQNYDDLLGATRHVRVATKRALRTLAKEHALDSLTTGTTASKAGDALTLRAQIATGDIATITYANGAKHALADWADTAIRTQTALAYNAGALDQYTGHGVEWVELVDGPDCGLTAHDDPEIANGMVISLTEARNYPLAHPRCARSILPRPDIASDRGAKAHNAKRDLTELERRSLVERQRAARSTVTGRDFRVHP